MTDNYFILQEASPSKLLACLSKVCEDTALEWGCPSELLFKAERKTFAHRQWYG